MTRLSNGFGISYTKGALGVVDIGDLAFEEGIAPTRSLSLADLCRVMLHVHLSKSKRARNWDASLDVEYAALDAAAGLMLYRRLQAVRAARMASLTPPTRGLRRRKPALEAVVSEVPAPPPPPERAASPALATGSEHRPQFDWRRGMLPAAAAAVFLTILVHFWG